MAAPKKETLCCVDIKNLQVLVPSCLKLYVRFSTSFPSRDAMNRSDSDSSLPRGSKPFLLSSRVQTLQGSGLSRGVLEKSSSLGELRGGSAGVLASAGSTRSLFITPGAADGLTFSSSSSSGSSRGTGLQVPARRSPAEEEEEAESSGSRRRNALNKIFKKKQGRH